MQYHNVYVYTVVDSMQNDGDSLNTNSKKKKWKNS